MFKSILVMLIVLYVYNTYISPISESVRRRRSRNDDFYRSNSTNYQTSNQQKPSPRKEDFIDYEEIKD